MFGGTGQCRLAGQTVLTTSGSVGVWYGNGAGLRRHAGPEPPHEQQRQLPQPHGQLSANARDRSAYPVRPHPLLPPSALRPPAVTHAGSATPPRPYAGVSVPTAPWATPTPTPETFGPLDLTQTHTFEWLLKNGQVDYPLTATSSQRRAYAVVLGSKWPAPAARHWRWQRHHSPPASGSMTILANAVDTSTIVDHLAPVPELTTAALLLAGLGFRWSVVPTALRPKCRLALSASSASSASSARLGFGQVHRQPRAHHVGNQRQRQRLGVAELVPLGPA